MKKVFGRLNVISILMFSIAFLLFVYSIWAAYNTQKYISEGVASQQIVVDGNEFNIFSFYMTNCIVYVVYGLILLGIGYICRKPKAVESMVEVAEVFEEEPIEVITEIKMEKKEEVIIE